MNKRAICTAAVLTCSISMLAGLPVHAQHQTVPLAQAAPSPRAATATLPTLCKGMRGSAVSVLQSMLVTQSLLSGNDVTGYFGDKTEEAVKQFQQRNDLPADGIIGTDTWRMLGRTLWTR